jgi:hypothetical protein
MGLLDGTFSWKNSKKTVACNFESFYSTCALLKKQSVENSFERKNEQFYNNYRTVCVEQLTKTLKWLFISKKFRLTQGHTHCDYSAFPLQDRFNSLTRGGPIGTFGEKDFRPFLTHSHPWTTLIHRPHWLRQLPVRVRSERPWLLLARRFYTALCGSIGTQRGK